MDCPVVVWVVVEDVVPVVAVGEAAGVSPHPTSEATTMESKDKRSKNLFNLYSLL